jgi:surfactin synthase thioesterase subunit
MGGSYLVAWHPAPDRHPVLLCLPPAGAGCGQFMSWQSALGLEVSVIGVQLPGRESRWADPEPSSMDEVVREVVGEIGRLLPPDHPVVVFGHSFGALLGYEIVRSLRAGRGQAVSALVIAGCRPPEHWVGAGRGLVDDERELDRLLDARSLEGDLGLDAETRELMREVLRADARLSLTYSGADLTPVDCPLEAWGGEKDETVTPEQIAGWSGYAAAGWRTRMFPGGHYFCVNDPAPALALLGPLIAPVR